MNTTFAAPGFAKLPLPAPTLSRSSRSEKQRADAAADFIGISAATRELHERIAEAARSDAKVLITGESGVGKEVVARLVHHQSRRGHAKLVTLNCAGIPDSLLASELFGHVRGSFTDAYRDQQGWLEQANHGTIFLDEIGEMSLQMQALLLRFMENGEVQRVGADRPSARLDVRIIAATNRRLLDRVSANLFREDLFYRLNVVQIDILPLRERREDIPGLLAHFLRLYSESHGVEMPHLSDGAASALRDADWRGNVRELRNVVERLVVHSNGSTITTAHLPREVLIPASAVQIERPAIVRHPTAVLFERMVHDREDFWKVVYAPFVSRDIARNDIRSLIRQALLLTRGNYKSVGELFNVRPGHQKRFMTFLQKHQCDLPALAADGSFSSAALSMTASEPLVASLPEAGRP